MNTSPNPSPALPDAVRQTLDTVVSGARGCGRFSSVDADATGVAARPGDPEIDAAFRVDWNGGGFEVALKTPDRWLSQSVEASLMNTGDDLEDLIDEELVELGCDDGPLPVKHFRDEQKQYVFVSPVPGDSAQTLVACLCAYERAFAGLGDFLSHDD